MNGSQAKSILYMMKYIRHVEETISEQYHDQKMRCPTHLCSGQESISAVVGHILNKQDYVVSTHRAHGHYLGKGGNLDAMIAEIYGKATGCSSGKGGSMHLIDESVGFMGSTAIVANSIPVGVGLALSCQLKKESKISCVFFGDASVEEGVFFEALNFAILRKLPVLFICENNLYSVYSPLRVRQPAGRKIYEMVAGFGIPTIHCEAHRVAPMYNTIKKQIDSIRRGDGPQFTEIATYRWREHCGPNYDNDIGYRTEAEYLSWRERDPLSVFEAELLSAGVLTQSELTKAQTEIEEITTKAFERALAAPFPDHREAYTGLFREMKSNSLSI